MYLRALAETDLRSKERKVIAMRHWKEISDEEKAEWKSRAQEEETKRSLSESALDEHDVQALEPDDASSTPLQQRKREYESHPDVAEKEALTQAHAGDKLRDDGEVFTCHLCDKDFDSAKALSAHKARSALHARLVGEPSPSKRQMLPKAEPEVPASNEDIAFVMPAAEKNNPASLDAAAERSARARRGWDKRRMMAQKKQVEPPSLSLETGRLQILECLMLTACLPILLNVSACTGLLAETDLRSKEREGMAMRDWKEISDEEKAEWKARAQAKERKRKRSLSDSAVDEHDVQTLEPDDASSTPLQQRKRKYESHADVAEKEALARKRHYCDLCDMSFATLQVLLQPLVLFHACTCMTQRRP